MAKPASLPRWATGGAAQVTEPTEGKKDTGWAPLEKPPAQYFNWWQKVVYQWAAYLDGLTNEVMTWAAKHTFAAGLASSVAPSAATDVVRKAELDALTAAPTWTALTPQSPHVGSGGFPLGFWKDTTGTVHVRGVVDCANGPVFTMTTLPAGARPSTSRTFPCAINNGFGALTVGTDGVVSMSLHTPASGDRVYLDVITFVAEQ